MRYILKIKEGPTLDEVISDLNISNPIKLDNLNRIIADTDDDVELQTWIDHTDIIRIRKDSEQQIACADMGTTTTDAPIIENFTSGKQTALALSGSYYYWHLDAMSKEDFSTKSNGEYSYKYDGLDNVDLIIVDSGVAGARAGASQGTTQCGFGTCGNTAYKDQYGCEAVGLGNSTWTPATLNPTIGSAHPDMLNDIDSNRVKPLPGFNLTQGGQYNHPIYGTIAMANNKDWNNEDTQGHGTHCAQFAAGRFAGIAKQANIFACKVMDLLGTGAGSGWTSDILLGLNAVLTWHNGKGTDVPSVINYSIANSPVAPADLFVDFDDPTNATDDTDDVMRQLTGAGVHVCMAAANGFNKIVNNEPQFQGPIDARVIEPARMSGPHWENTVANTITVGAVGFDGLGGYDDSGVNFSGGKWSMSYFSNYGSSVTISAPGQDLNTIGWYDAGGGNWGTTTGQAGTSYSSPLIAGVICNKIHQNRIEAANIGGSPEEIKNWLIASSSFNIHFTSWIRQRGEKGSHTDSVGGVSDTGNALIQTIKYDNDYIYTHFSGIAEHATGPFPGSSGAGYVPADKSYIKAIARNPLKNIGIKTVTPVGMVGISVNGVPIFNKRDNDSWHTANAQMETSTGGNIWRKNAFVIDGSTKDTNYGFCTSDFRYNYKTASPTLRLELNDIYTSGTANHSPIIGWALDGYPIYGPFGNITANNSSSGITKMVPGWRLKTASEYDPSTDGARTCSVRVTAGSYSPENNTTWGPAVDGSNPLGTFIEDYIYDSTVSNRHLDQYNGRDCVTPEFPNGTYAYFSTIETSGNAYSGEPMFPYVLAEEFYGYVHAQNISNNAVSVPSSVTTWNTYGATATDKITKIASKIKLPDNPLKTTSGSGSIMITWPDHGLKADDWIQLNGTTGGANLISDIYTTDPPGMDPGNIININPWVLNDWHVVTSNTTSDQVEITLLNRQANANGQIGGSNAYASVLKTGTTSTPANLTTHDSTDGLLKMDGATVGGHAGVTGAWNVDYQNGGPNDNTRKWRLKWNNPDGITVQAAPTGQDNLFHIEYTPTTITPNRIGFSPNYQIADWTTTWVTSTTNFATFYSGAVIDQDLSATITSWANEKIGETDYTLIGNLPSELTFSKRTGKLTGTLGTYETSNVYSFTITANNGYTSTIHNYSFTIGEGDELGYYYDGSTLTVPGNLIAKAGWTTATSNLSATVGAQYLVDTTSNTVTITLPASPVTGNYIRVVDAAGNSNTNKIIVARNGKNIQGTAQDLEITSSRAGLTLVYYDATNGWVIAEN